ncbi:MAG: 2-dehydro-3-deoxyphosphooctonate aldolase [Flavobacterium sp.]|jgi:hypothetical protein|uniref:2-dehydro-3-deoxyphosphooctonate aldolase n=2 Tax=Flavobacterium sp. TaxID=239 RepID=UPI0022C9D7E2|nr:2-dehydro-3-deoxyphosphooctonate aldolase [Flavobacterium sp.]MCZ8168784.1 2-dehydro-3-deoxyphosphooctonate aldolase [Flavobacterium sp.]MCZ8295957.1 2-dehydro-3-deoxyphosphooctonate aldolase [Flavobacterium sp.]
MKKSIAFLFLLALVTSCGSGKFVIKNIDNSVRKLQTVDGHFDLKEYATDDLYGYNMEYPINLGYDNERNNPRNVDYFFKALAGPNGEPITWKKIEVCCPYESKKSTTGAGTLEIYEVSYGTTSLRLYVNLFEKGKLLCPKGLTIKK